MNHINAAQIALHEHLFCLQHGGKEELVVRRHHGDAALLDGGRDLTGFIQIQAQWLFRHQMFAGFCCCHNRFTMQVVRQCDVHRIDFGIIEQFMVIAINAHIVADLGNARLGGSF